ncbi:hypothetical protein RR46_02161 [Papilio xuthus]|uniref:Uncharacterized protein n=1 Tax=Papilio xuthus TaxID=66420 RepID=A0A194QKW2_PAPXU|nr:hypothetical protein RR46_02161 [Papilio xuthus]
MQVRCGAVRCGCVPAAPVRHPQMSGARARWLCTIAKGTLMAQSSCSLCVEGDTTTTRRRHGGDKTRHRGSVIFALLRPPPGHQQHGSPRRLVASPQSHSPNNNSKPQQIYKTIQLRCFN